MYVVSYCYMVARTVVRVVQIRGEGGREREREREGWRVGVGGGYDREFPFTNLMDCEVHEMK